MPRNESLKKSFSYNGAITWDNLVPERLCKGHFLLIGVANKVSETSGHYNYSSGAAGY